MMTFGCCRVIAKGQVAEQGTHESLAEGGGIYSALVGIALSSVPSCLWITVSCSTS